MNVIFAALSLEEKNNTRRKKPRYLKLLVLWMTALEEQRDVENKHVRPRI